MGDSGLSLPRCLVGAGLRAAVSGLTVFRKIRDPSGSRWKSPLPTILLAAALVLASMSLGVLPASAAIIVWDGGGATNNWSEAANWLGDVVPGPADVATFDATSVKAATIDGAINVAGVDINAGYTGTITQAAG